MNTERVVNEELQTIDYVRNTKNYSKKQLKKLQKTGSQQPVILRIARNIEKNKLVFQMGTGKAVTALEAAQFVAKDVDAIDINLGCKKKISVSGGMGSQLLKDVERASDIIKTLKRNLQIPVSCKIRLLEDTRKTVDFC